MSLVSLSTVRSLLAAAPRRGRGRAYSPALVQQALEVVRQQRERGRTLEQIASALGVPLSSILRWQRGASADRAHRAEVVSGAFLPVELTSVRTGGVVVHGPGGLRVEGLNVEMLSVLLRSLM